MPHLRTSIGEHLFWRLDGEVPHPQETVTVEARPGVDDELIFREGRHGETFELISRVDQVTSILAQQRVALYKQLVGADPVQLWIGGYLHDFRVVVRHVSKLEAAPLANATPGLFPPSLGLLVCRWALHPVYVS